MPKITLVNSKTGNTQEFEPVDAREVLAGKDTIYEMPGAKKGRKAKQLGSTPDEVNVPQHQGDDAEMQVGLPIEKYGRSNVVRAEPGMVHVDRNPRTSGEPEETQPLVKRKAVARKASVKKSTSRKAKAVAPSATAE